MRFLLLVLIGLTTHSICNAQYYNNNEETIELINGEPFVKEFNAANINELHLTNKHGFINLTSWDKEIIQIEVIVNVETTVKYDEEEFLKLVSFDHRSYSHQLHYKTVFSDDFFSNNPFTINYTVKVPARISLNIKNSIGDVKVENIEGTVKLNHSYGNLELRNLANDKEHVFELSFIEGLIDNFGKAKVNLANSTLNMNKGLKVEGKTNYCMASFTDIASTKLQSFTDRLTITNADSISLKGTQFIGKLDQVQTYLFCEIDKGQLLVNASENIKNITISNNRVNTTLVIPHTVSYLINGEVFKGEFTHPSPQNLQLFKEDDNVTFSGSIGNDNEQSTNIILFNKDASITIKN